MQCKTRELPCVKLLACTEYVRNSLIGNVQIENTLDFCLLPVQTLFSLVSQFGLPTNVCLGKQEFIRHGQITVHFKILDVCTGVPVWEERFHSEPKELGLCTL